MKLQTASTLTLIAAALTLATAPAQAFTGFSFSTEFTPDASHFTPSNVNYDPLAPKKDIFLKSVTVKGTGEKVDDFELVSGAKIITNGTNLGPGSSDRGDLASGIALEKATAASVVASLGNLNLNNIIDTEDNLGPSSIEVYFKKAVKRFFFFERGANSDLTVEAIGRDGTVKDTFQIVRGQFQKVGKSSNMTGYSIDTTEIGGAQKVGSYGLSLTRGDIIGLRLSSDNTSNGPDYKVVAAKVPEPATIAGLGMVAGAAVLARRKKNQAAEAAQ
jgi:PEP-CTERM motif